MKSAQIGAFSLIALALLAASSWEGLSPPGAECQRAAERSADLCGQARLVMGPALQLAQTAIKETGAGDARLASISAAHDMLTGADVIAAVNTCLSADRAKGAVLVDAAAGVDEAVQLISKIRTTGHADGDDHVTLTRILRDLHAVPAP